MVSARREPKGQRLAVVYKHNTPEETFEHDVFLHKNKAMHQWRFVKPSALCCRRPGLLRAGRCPVAVAARTKALSRHIYRLAPLGDNTFSPPVGSLLLQL